MISSTRPIAGTTVVAQLETDRDNGRAHCRHRCRNLRGRRGCGRDIRADRRPLGRGAALLRTTEQDCRACAGGSRRRAGDRQRAALRTHRRQGLGAGEPRRTAADHGWALLRAWRARPRPRAGQPNRHRDRGGARLRHRPSWHDARLPARARSPPARAATAPRARPRHRQRRARDCGGARTAQPHAGDRHRCFGGTRRARQCAAQPRRRADRSCRTQTASRRTSMHARHSISSSPIFCSARSSGWQRRSRACSHPTRTSFCPAC